MLLVLVDSPVWDGACAATCKPQARGPGNVVGQLLRRVFSRFRWRSVQIRLTITHNDEVRRHMSSKTTRARGL
jgi:hypothetical protein